MNREQYVQSQRKRFRRRLWIYGLGLVLLTDVLTIVFLRLLDDGDETVETPTLVQQGPEDRSDGVRGGSGDGSGDDSSQASALARAASGEPAQQAAAASGPAAEVAAQAGQQAAVMGQQAARVLIASVPPGASVRRNGQDLGLTPLTIDVPGEVAGSAATVAARGAGALEIVKDGYEPRLVELAPGQTKIRVRLAPVVAQAPPGTARPRPLQVGNGNRPQTGSGSQAAAVQPGAAAQPGPAAQQPAVESAQPAAASKTPASSEPAPQPGAAATGPAQGAPAGTPPRQTSDNPDPWAKPDAPAGETKPANPNPWNQ